MLPVVVAFGVHTGEVNHVFEVDLMSCSVGGNFSGDVVYKLINFLSVKNFIQGLACHT